MTDRLIQQAEWRSGGARTVRFAAPHRLGTRAAMQRILTRCRAAEASGALRFLKETDWWANGCAFGARALGQTLRGELKVTDSTAEIDLKVDGALGFFAERIARFLEEEAMRILGQPEQDSAIPTPVRRIRHQPGDGAEDVVIGVVSGYGWDEARIWATSLCDSGFAGDRVVIAVDPGPCLQEHLEGLGFRVVLPSPERGSLPFVVERFRLVARFLARSAYRFAIVTDVRDVVFQSNPSTWLEANSDVDRPILASSEGVRIGDEWWGSCTLLDSFGADALDRVRAQPSCNAGVIAGRADHVGRLASEIVSLCTSDGIKGADQAAFNLLVNAPDWARLVETVTQDRPWACQAGTVADTRQALTDALLDPPPVLRDGRVETSRGIPYAIVHQYDRVPQWRVLFESMYAGTVRQEAEAGASA